MYKAQANSTPANFLNGEVSLYLQNIAIRNRTTFSINGKGERFYIVDGKPIPAKDFEAMYPIQLVRKSVKGERIGGAQQIY